MRAMKLDVFLKEYTNKLMDGKAALFAGAGLSKPAGFVDWRELMKEIAEDLGLEVDKEHDLIALAQFHLNERRTRSVINDKLIHEFTKHSVHTVNHTRLAKLPISTIWTTNYDDLLENAFRNESKHVDVKLTPMSVSQSKSGTDVTIFKMHGDASIPGEAVITKDDYETYELKHHLFTIKLQADLITYSFLFLGYSFTDPNIDYILSRIRMLHGDHVPTHYCIMRRPNKMDNPSAAGSADYEYNVRKMDLRIEDLKRYGIQTVLVDEYSEISNILQALNYQAFAKNIFVSGSAVIGTDDFNEARLHEFSRFLGSQLIKRGYNLVSGYGYGIGADILTGALESAYTSHSNMRERLVLRPFPHSIDDERKDEVFQQWRLSMITISGFTIYLAGNKYRNAVGGEIVDADGVMEEYLLANNEGSYNCPIPIGATGFVAQKIWRIVSEDIYKYYRGADVSAELSVVNSASKTDLEIVEAIFSIINKIKRIKC